MDLPVIAAEWLGIAPIWLRWVLYIVGFIVIWRLFGGFFIKVLVKKIQNRLTKQIMQAMSVNKRLDKELMKQLVKDITKPDTPIGAIASFFPNVTQFLDKHPERIIGFFELAVKIPNLLEQIPKMQAFLGQVSKGIPALGQKEDPTKGF